MTFPTVQVTVNLRDLTGQPCANVPVTAKLDKNDAFSSPSPGGIVIAKSVTEITDDTGVAVLTLFPNNPSTGLGIEGSVYHFSAPITSGRSFRATAQIPNSDCNIQDVMDLDAVPTLSSAQAASAAAQAYASQAATSAASCSGAATSATNAAASATAAASSATSASTSATSASNSAAAASSSATAAATSATNAASSATSASTSASAASTSATDAASSASSASTYASNAATSASNASSSATSASGSATSAATSATSASGSATAATTSATNAATSASAASSSATSAATSATSAAASASVASALVNGFSMGLLPATANSAPVNPGVNYAPGDTITFAGGTATRSATITVTSTQAVSATVVNGGSGGTPGPVTITATTGTAAQLAQFSGTISAGGVLQGPLTLVTPGQYTVNPTTPATEPVTGGSLSGAQINIVMGVLWAGVTDVGRYTVPPAQPVAQASSSGSGTGLTINALWGPIAAGIATAAAGSGGGQVGIVRIGGDPSVGVSAAGRMAYGTESVYIGGYAGCNVTSGNFNTVVGFGALSFGAGVNLTGDSNSVFGADAMRNAGATANVNCAFGASALRNVTGAGNSAFGTSALWTLTSGNNNVAVGLQAGFAVTTGGNGVYIGYHAGNAVTTANSNVFIGYQAGLSVTTGGGNVIIGPNVGSTTAQTGNTNILIGTSSAVDTPNAGKNNWLNIGNVIYGDLTANTGGVALVYRRTSKTAGTTTVTVSDGNYDNLGAGAQTVYNLPATPQVGEEHSFAVLAAQNMKINAGTGIVINVGGTASSTAGNLQSSQVGASVTLQAVSTTLWVARAVTGTGGSTGAGGWTVA